LGFCSQPRSLNPYPTCANQRIIYAENAARGLWVIEAAPASEAAREIDALAKKSTAQEKGKRLEQEDERTHDAGDRTAAAREEAGGS
jgi:hypothetical protein